MNPTQPKTDVPQNSAHELLEQLDAAYARARERAAKDAADAARCNRTDRSRVEELVRQGLPNAARRLAGRLGRKRAQTDRRRAFKRARRPA